MASKYQVLCQAVSRKSFTEAAKVLHHSQSAVSQAVKAVEQEVGLTLVLRKKVISDLWVLRVRFSAEWMSWRPWDWRLRWQRR